MKEGEREGEREGGMEGMREREGGRKRKKKEFIIFSIFINKIIV